MSPSRNYTRPFLRSYRSLIVLLALLGICQTEAQIVDSLENRLSHPGLTSNDRIEILYLLSRELTFVDLSRSMDYAQQSLKLARNSGNREGEAYAYRILGSIYSKNEDYFLGIQYLQKAMAYFESEEDAVGLANCYISLGHIYRNLENRSKEIEFHTKAYTIFRDLGIRERYAVSAHNLGESYYLNGQLDDAELLTDKAIELNTNIGNLPVLTNCLKVKGLIELARGNIRNAELQFKRLLDISATLGPNTQKISAAEALIRLSLISAQLGDTGSELEYLLQAENHCKSNALFDFLEEVYHNLVLYHLKSDNANQARQYAEARHSTTEAFHQKLISDRSKLVEGMVQIDALNQRADFLETQTLLQSQEIETRNWLIAIIGCCIILLLWFARKTWVMNRKLHSNYELIQKQKSELETLNATKDKFFSVVAHDIRSPLNSLKSFVDLLIENYELMTEDEVHTMAGELDRSVKSTLRMADNLILWAKDQMKKTPEVQMAFPIQEVISEVYNVMRDSAEQKRITLSAETDSTLEVYGNRQQFEFIIRNLVNNAIKYTPSSGKVAIGVRRDGLNRVRVFVTDTGMGMDKATMEGLFELDGDKSRLGTNGEKGSGLGLTLSHEFARRNSGSIEVESTPQQGTSFYVIMPIGSRAA